MNEAGNRFFAALHTAATARLGADHACTRALAEAMGGAAPERTAAAQDALNRLEGPVLAELMEVVHKTLREDPAAILAAWRPSGGGRPS